MARQTAAQARVNPNPNVNVGFGFDREEFLNAPGTLRDQENLITLCTLLRFTLSNHRES